MAVNDIKNNMSSGQLDPRLAARHDSPLVQNGANLIKNMLPMTFGGATKRPGLKYIAAAGNSSYPVRNMPFVYSATDAYGLEFGHFTIRVFAEDAQALDGGSALEIVSPYSSADLWGIKYCQIADVMYLVHPDYHPQWLYRDSAGDWTIEDVPFVWGPFLSENETATTLTPSDVTGSITLAASAALFNANHVGAYFQIKGIDITSGDMTAATHTVGAVSLETGESVVASLSGTWVGTMKLQRSYDGGSTWLDYISYTANSSIEITALEPTQYRWYCSAYTSGTATGQLSISEQAGYVQITAVASTTSATATVIETLPSTDAVTTWNEGAFSVHQGYPKACRFYEQRLELMGTVGRPLTIHGSKVDNYVNFDRGVANDDDAYMYPFAGNQVNLIQWAVDSDILFVGTSGGTWRFGDPNEPTTASAPFAKVQGSYGTADIQGLLVGGAIYYLERGAKRLRFSEYDYRPEKWVPHDISKRAESMLKQGVKELHFQSSPENILWLLMEDGYLVSCTIDMDNQMIAFAEHETDGLFESMCVFPGSDRDICQFATVRTINGSTVRYIEQMQPDISGSGTTSQTTEVFALSDESLDGAKADSGYAESSGQSITYDSGYIRLQHRITPSVVHYDSVITFAPSSLAHGDEIISAVVSGYVYGQTFAAAVNYKVHCEKCDDFTKPSTFADFYSRVLTDGVSGSFPAATYSDHDTFSFPDITEDLQEIVDRPGYAAGQSVGVFVITSSLTHTGASQFLIYSNPGTGYPLTLDVTYKTKTGEILTEIVSAWDGFFVDAGMTFHNYAGITDVTQANPGVVTAPAHEFTNGMTVEINQVEGMEDLNGNQYTVANVATDTFELSGTDASGFDAYTGGGVAEQVVTTITGAGHLEAEAVSVLADRTVVTGKTVASGQITLTTPAKKVHLGLGYDADVDPTLFERGDQSGVSYSRKKSVHNPSIILHDSYGLQLGPDPDHLKDMVGKFTAGELLTGAVQCDFLQGAALDKARVFLRNDLPTPFTVLAIVANVVTGEL
jgi:hypothetical protein